MENGVAFHNNQSAIVNHKLDLTTKNIMNTIKFLPAIAAALITLVGYANAQNLRNGEIETNIAIGDVNLLNSVTGESRPLTPGTVFGPGVAIQTGDNASALLFLSNGSAINLRANSYLEIKAFVQAPFQFVGSYASLREDPNQSKTELHLSYGEFVGEVQNLQPDSNYNITTPAGSTRILGTMYLIGFQPDGANAQAEVINLNGQVITTIDANTLNVAPGKALSVSGSFVGNTWTTNSSNIIDAIPSQLSQASIYAVEIQDARGGNPPAGQDDDPELDEPALLSDPDRVITVSPI